MSKLGKKLIKAVEEVIEMQRKKFTYPYEECAKPKGCVFCGGECPYHIPEKPSDVQDGECFVPVADEGNRGETH